MVVPGERGMWVCMITNIIQVKKWGEALISFDDLMSRIGNKSVFDQNELRKNMIMIGMLLFLNCFTMLFLEQVIILTVLG